MFIFYYAFKCTKLYKDTIMSKHKQASQMLQLLDQLMFYYAYKTWSDVVFSLEHLECVNLESEALNMRFT